MELANVMIALNGKRGNTIPRYGISPAEVMVLIQLHGPDAVFDIVPIADENLTEEQRVFAEMTPRTMRAHLLQAYPKMQERESVIPHLFPAPNGRDIPEQFAELDLDESLYKAVSRAKPAPVKAKDKAAARKRDREERMSEDDQRAAADDLLNG